MSTTREMTDQKCRKCGEPMERLHRKSPFIDDSVLNCANVKCDDFEHGSMSLNAWERTAARREMAEGRE